MSGIKVSMSKHHRGKIASLFNSISVADNFCTKAIAARDDSNYDLWHLYRVDAVNELFDSYGIEVVGMSSYAGVRHSGSKS